jgi:diguanylate cyclase (GGDEF)-like protein
MQLCYTLESHLYFPPIPIQPHPPQPLLVISFGVIILNNGQTSKPAPAFEKQSVQADTQQAQIDQLNHLAWQLRVSDPDRALALSTEALHSANAGIPLYRQGVAASLITLSFLDGEAGKLDRALARSLEALEYIKDGSHPELLVGAWYTLGWAYYYSSNYPAALEFGLKSLQLAREAGLQEWQAWCLDLTASTYKEPQQALLMHEEAHAIFQRTGNPTGQSRILNNWACTLLETQQFNAALEMAQKSLQLAREGGLKRDEINIAATIGEIHAKLGEYEQAHSGLQHAMQLFDTYGHDISSVYVLVELGQVHLEQHDLDRAEQELVKALAVARHMEMRNEQARCHKCLSEIHEQRGQFKIALEHYKAFQALQESISGEGALKQLTALRVSHQIETAQRDAEIHRLQKEKLQIELDEHKRLHTILEDLATRDPLTNLFNRRHFLSLAEQEWRRARRYHHPLCALMLDVDDFKQINDLHGHAAGDKALTAFANIIRSTLRSTEIAGRYGGDEFVVLLPETLPQHGLLVAKRICHEITDYAISSDIGPIELTPSIGVASATKDNLTHIQSLDELLNHADKAMYTAKRTGTGQVHLYAE